MAEITAQLVKELREITGAGMMDCKRALEEAGGDLERAIDVLRTKGLSKAAKKAERVASEGAVGLALKKHGAGMTGAAVELNAETDFVARNELFQGAVRHAADAALEAGEAIEAINAHKTSTGQTVSEVVTHLIATIGENMLLRRAAVFTVEKGVVAGYAHNAIAPNIGRIGVLVAVEGEGDQEVLQEMGKDIALHIAAFNPLSLSVDDLDPAAVERERAIFAEQAAGSGKPANVVEKMVEGRLRKFYEEVVLLKQAFAKNSDITVEQLVAETAKKVGSPVKVAGFVRLALGEGVEKVAGPDLASEVASMISKS